MKNSDFNIDKFIKKLLEVRSKKNKNVKFKDKELITLC